MVADKVEIQTLSHQEDAIPAHWTCDGSTSFSIKKRKKEKKEERISSYILARIQMSLPLKHASTNLLDKYCKFLPIPIYFDEKNINETKPLWLQSPTKITDEEYTEFYSKLYPMAEPPLFWIHLNVGLSI